MLHQSLNNVYEQKQIKTINEIKEIEKILGETSASCSNHGNRAVIDTAN